MTEFIDQLYFKALVKGSEFLDYINDVRIARAYYKDLLQQTIREMVGNSNYHEWRVDCDESNNNGDPVINATVSFMGYCSIDLPYGQPKDVIQFFQNKQ